MTNKGCILPLSYWGSIQYFSKFLLHDVLALELHEHFPKKTYRNRCELYGANGLQTLNIPIAKTTGKTQIKDIKIAYHTPWQKEHVRTLTAAYASSPYYEYYVDDILPLYENKAVFLKDLNENILKVCLAWLDLPENWHYTNSFELNPEAQDYRSRIHPKKETYLQDATFKAPKYMQGFEQRNGFLPNLSILDLIFNTGPEALSLLESSLIPEAER